MGSFTGSPCTLSSGSCGVTYSDTASGSPTITATYSDNTEAVGLFGGRLGFGIEIYTIGSLVGSLSTVPVLFKDPETAKLVDEMIKRMEIWKMTLG